MFFNGSIFRILKGNHFQWRCRDVGIEGDGGSDGKGK